MALDEKVKSMMAYMDNICRWVAEHRYKYHNKFIICFAAGQ